MDGDPVNRVISAYTAIVRGSETGLGGCGSVSCQRRVDCLRADERLAMREPFDPAGCRFFIERGDVPQSLEERLRGLPIGQSIRVADIEFVRTVDGVTVDDDHVREEEISEYVEALFHYEAVDSQD